MIVHRLALLSTQHIESASILKCLRRELHSNVQIIIFSADV
jgi:hypothetical protein